MMTRIEGGERLAAIGDAAMAAGNLKPEESQRLHSRLREMASGSRERATPASPAALAAMGIGIRPAPSTPSEKPENGG